MLRRLAFGVLGLALVVLVVQRLAVRGGDPDPSAVVANLPVAAASATPQPASQPTAVPDLSPVARLVIKRLGIDAPAVILGVDSQGIMEAPSTPTDVAWYRFSAHPGQNSNVVIAGHVDFANYGTAVFWRLHELNQGDQVEVRLVDGRSFVYQVASLTYYDADTAPVVEIVGPTRTETLTLITCSGVFDPQAREYDKRLVVRANLLEGS